MSGFHDPAGHAFVPALEAAFPAILEEARRLTDGNFMRWPERMLYEGRWDIFGLFVFGAKLAKNCALCPATAAAVQAVPRMTTAGFSWMGPRTEIKPHVGYTHAVLRAHLPLIVPEGCFLRVGGEKRPWVPGKVMVFDDTVEHSASNPSDERRVILLLDFVKEGRTYRPHMPPEQVQQAFER